MGINALLVDPNLISRERFQNLSKQNGSFHKVVCSSMLSEGMERLRLNHSYRAVYISTSFDSSTISNFICDARRLKQSESLPQLLVVDRQNKNLNLKQFGKGSPDGYLLEPLVPSDLDSSVKFIENFSLNSRSWKLEDSELKSPSDNPEEELENMDSDKIKAICARLSVAVNRGRPGMKDLKEISKHLHALSDEQVDTYFEHLIDHFSNIKLEPELEIAAKKRSIKTVKKRAF
jgi:hypothetical protein